MEIEIIDTPKLSRSPFAIKIVRVFSPTLMWIHLQNSEESFQEMMENLNKRMNQRRFVHLNTKMGDTIALETKRGWQRGIVTKMNGDGTAQVALRDWGVYIRHPINDLYQLEQRFREHYWQAVPCGLAYTGPPGTGSSWSRRAINIARSIAEQQTGYMQIVKPIRDDAALIKLDIKNETNNVYRNLRDLLIELGVAQKIATITTNVIPSILI